MHTVPHPAPTLHTSHPATNHPYRVPQVVGDARAQPCQNGVLIGDASRRRSPPLHPHRHQPWTRPRLQFPASQPRRSPTSRPRTGARRRVLPPVSAVAAERVPHHAEGVCRGQVRCRRIDRVRAHNPSPAPFRRRVGVALRRMGQGLLSASVLRGVDIAAMSNPIHVHGVVESQPTRPCRPWVLYQ